MMTILPATRFRLAALTRSDTGAVTMQEAGAFVKAQGLPVIGIATGLGAAVGTAAAWGAGGKVGKGAVIGGAVLGGIFAALWGWQYLSLRDAPTS